MLTVLALIPFLLSIAAAVAFARRANHLALMFLTLTLTCFLAAGVALAYGGDTLLNQTTEPQPAFYEDEFQLPPDPKLDRHREGLQDGDECPRKA